MTSSIYPASLTYGKQIYNPSFTYVANQSVTSDMLIKDSTVTQDRQIIDGAEYRELQEDRKLLYALIDAGVEDWEGYETAIGLLGES